MWLSNYVNSWLIDAATNNIHNNLKKKKYPMWLKTGQNNLISKTVTKETYDFHYIYT